MFKPNLTSGQRDYLDKVASSLIETVPADVRAQAVEYARRLMENGMPVLFDQRHLAVVSGVPSQVIGTIAQRPEAFYSTFRIRKRSGGSRPVSAPTPVLKKLQHWIHHELTTNFWVHPSCHGFVRNKSILTNAAPHVDSSVVLKLDIRDFFGSVRRDRVYRMYRLVGYSRTVSDMLAALTTLDGKLPQGAPTSPDLANFAAYHLDVRLTAFSGRHGLMYTRYADDLTFSGGALRNPKMKRTIEHIMRDEGFAPNERKVRFLERSERQIVTGVIVNEKPNWPRERKRWLRQEIYYLKKFGVEGHLERRGIEYASYKEHLYGHVYALNSVCPDVARCLLASLDTIRWPY